MTRARKIEVVIADALTRDGDWLINDDRTIATHSASDERSGHLADLDIAYLAAELDAEFDRIASEAARG